MLAQILPPDGVISIEYKCPHCGHHKAIAYPQGEQIRQVCASCDRYQKWMEKRLYTQLLGNGGVA